MSDAEAELRPPNLFEVAASVPLETATIAWLLEAADKSRAATAPGLHAVGFDLLRAFFDCAGVAPPPVPMPVRVLRNVEGTDLVVEAGREWVVAITHAHDVEWLTKGAGAPGPRKPMVGGDPRVTFERRLRRQWVAVWKRLSTRAYPATTYLWLREESDLELVDAWGWKLVGRDALRDVLGPHRRRHVIVAELAEHLDRLDAEAHAFRTTPPASWSPLAWSGFLRALAPILGGRWGWLTHPRGGFWGLWWGGVAVEDGVLSLRIESGEVVVRLAVAKGRAPKRAREAWASRLVRHEGAVRFVRLGKLGAGPTVTVARLAGGYLRCDRADRVDFEATVEALRHVTDALGAAAVQASRATV